MLLVSFKQSKPPNNHLYQYILFFHANSEKLHWMFIINFTELFAEWMPSHCLVQVVTGILPYSWWCSLIITEILKWHGKFGKCLHILIQTSLLLASNLVIVMFCWEGDGYKMSILPLNCVWCWPMVSLSPAWLKVKLVIMTRKLICGQKCKDLKSVILCSPTKHLVSYLIMSDARCIVNKGIWLNAKNKNIRSNI